jgi:predicted nucleic acid-binding Zn finger protein
MISALVLGEVAELLSRVRSWLVVHREEALLLGVVSCPCHEVVISSVLPGIKDDCKENGLEQT